MRRLLAAATAILVLAVGVSLSTASAAQLPVFAGLQTTYAEASGCAAAVSGGEAVVDSTAGGTSSGGSYTQVTLSSIPASCMGQGLTVQTYVHLTNGTIVSGSPQALPAGPGTVTVSVPSYPAASVEAVVTKIGGWIFPTNWTEPAPFNPTPPNGPVTCYRLDASGSVVTDSSGNGVPCSPSPTVSVNEWGDDVYSPAYLQVQWQQRTSQARSLLVFDFSHPAYSAYAGDPSESSVTISSYYGSSQVRPGYSCAALPVFELEVLHPNTGNGSQRLSGEVLLSTPTQPGAVCN